VHGSPPLVGVKREMHKKRIEISIPELPSALSALATFFLLYYFPPPFFLGLGWSEFMRVEVLSSSGLCTSWNSYSPGGVVLVFLSQWFDGVFFFSSLVFEHFLIFF